MKSKKILIVTYYWPPSGGVGVQRWLFFSQYLNSKGFEVIIYTPENPQFDLLDNELLEQTKGIRVVKSKIWEPFNLIAKFTGNKSNTNIKQGLILDKEKKSLVDKVTIWLRGNVVIPDPRVFWVKKAVKDVSSLVKSENIDLLITTSPPHSVQLIGKGVKKKTNVRWLADFRDPWSEWDTLEKLQVSAPILTIHRYLERSVLKMANMVTTVSPTLAKSFDGKANTSREVKVLYNGVAISKSNRILESSSHNNFVMGYVGILNELRGPQAFWDLLDDKCAQDEMFKANLKIRLAGIVSDAIFNGLKRKKHIGGKFEFLGYLAHSKVFEAYESCDLLMLFLNISENAKWILPMKFFEYLQSNTPILAIGPKVSDLRVIMEGKMIGKYFEYDDKIGISDFISEVAEGKFKVEEKDRDAMLHSFSKEASAERLIELISQIE